MPDSRPFLGQNCASPYSRGENARRLAWAAVQATLFRWSPRPCHGFRAGLLRAFGADIPDPGKVVVFPSARVDFPWRLTLAPRAMLGPRVTVANVARVTLEYGANVSQNTHLCSGSHDYRQWSMPVVSSPIVIGENAWVAADVFVGPGVTIGPGCVVGARSVVVRDLPGWHICVGHPCRPIRPREVPH